MLKSCCRHCLHLLRCGCCIALALLPSRPNLEVGLRDSYSLQRWKPWPHTSFLSCPKGQLQPPKEDISGQVRATTAADIVPFSTLRLCLDAEVFPSPLLLLAVSKSSLCSAVAVFLSKDQKSASGAATASSDKFSVPLTLLSKKEDKNW